MLNKEGRAKFKCSRIQFGGIKSEWNIFRYKLKFIKDCDANALDILGNLRNVD